MNQTKHLFSRKPYGHRANNRSMGFTKWWIDSSGDDILYGFTACREVCGDVLVYFIYDEPMDITL
jgi:hypothetical protein